MHKSSWPFEQSESLTIRLPVPDWGPGRTRVVGAEDDPLRPPRVESGNHDRAWLQQIDSKATIAGTVRKAYQYIVYSDPG